MSLLAVILSERIMAKARCEICGKNFKNEEGLEQHNAVKHSVGERKKGINFKKSRNFGIFIVVIGIIIGLIVWIVIGAVEEANSCKTDPVNEINIGGHTNLKLHTHSNLNIVIDEQQQIIPANIGVFTGIMRPIHTHDSSGELHIEGPCQRDFTLGDFFTIWGREFNSQCIFDNCADSGELKMVVNGKENKEFENYVLKDEDNILIEYISR